MEPDFLIVKRFQNLHNILTPCEAYGQVLMRSDSEIIVYCHDDVTIHESGWLRRVLAPFDRPDCIAVGLGGANSLGRPNLYKRPYQIVDMSRGGYRSNQTDWEVHGTHEIGESRVAVLDAFVMAVRRDFLLGIGGWPTAHLTHHCLDLWLACEAARAGKEIWQVGAGCTHHGGGSSTKPAYRGAAWLQGGTLEEDHRQPHRWLYDNYRDVLPIREKEEVVL